MQRMLIYASRCVTTDPHGWELDYDDTDLELRSPDGRAQLRVRPYECTPAPSMADLLSLIKQLPESNGNTTAEVRVGQYYGYALDSIDPADGTFIRDHVVSLAEIVLDVTFYCPSGSQDQYLPLVEPIIDSLRDNRP